MQKSSRDRPVSSRDAQLSLTGLDTPRADLTVVDHETAVALLDTAVRTFAPSDARLTSDPDTVGRLVKACRRLPLVLRVAAALLETYPTLSAGELADQLCAAQERLDGPPNAGVFMPSATSVEAVSEVSYGLLAEIAARVFRLLPVSPGPDLSITAAAELADMPVGDLRPVLRELASAHLAEAVSRYGRRWRLQSWVHPYAQQLSDAHAEADHREQARDRLLAYYLRMAKAADEHLRALQGTVVRGIFSSRRSALAWLDAEHASLIAAIQMAVDTGRDLTAMVLPLRLAQYFALRRQFEDLLATTAVSLDIARRLGDRRREGHALNNMGGALQELSRFDEAITAHQRAASAYQETGDRHAEGAALNNLGVALKGARRFEEAITVHQEAAAIYQETGDRHAEGTALNNLGIALKRVRRFDQAIAACQEAAAILMESGDRHGEGNALNNLGGALQESGRPEEAISAYQCAVLILRETGDQYALGVTLNNLGGNLREVGRLDEAVTTYEAAAAIFREADDSYRQKIALENLEETRIAQLAL